LLTLILLFLLLSELVSSLLLVFHNSTCSFFFFLFKIKSWLLSSWNSIQLIFFYPFFLFFCRIGLLLNVLILYVLFLLHI
jgi:hypothetical protein